MPHRTTATAALPGRQSGSAVRPSDSRSPDRSLDHGLPSRTSATGLRRCSKTTPRPCSGRRRGRARRLRSRSRRRRSEPRMRSGCCECSARRSQSRRWVRTVPDGAFVVRLSAHTRRSCARRRRSRNSGGSWRRNRSACSRTNRRGGRKRLRQATRGTEDHRGCRLRRKLRSGLRGRMRSLSRSLSRCRSLSRSRSRSRSLSLSLSLSLSRSRSMRPCRRPRPNPPRGTARR